MYLELDKLRFNLLHQGDTENQNKWLIIAQAQCKGYRVYGPTLTKEPMYSGHKNNAKLPDGEENMNFCQLFKFQWTQKWIYCHLGKFYRGQIYDVVDLHCPSHDKTILEKVIFTTWSQDGFRRVLAKEPNCYRNKDHGDAFNFRTFLTPIPDDRADKYIDRSFLVLTETLTGEGQHSIITNDRNIKASKVQRLINTVAKLFPRVGELCSTNCTNDIREI